jgi:hypothetical protein
VSLLFPEELSRYWLFKPDNGQSNATFKTSHDSAGVHFFRCRRYRFAQFMSNSFWTDFSIANAGSKTKDERHLVAVS